MSLDAVVGGFTEVRMQRRNCVFFSNKIKKGYRRWRVSYYATADYNGTIGENTPRVLIAKIRKKTNVANKNFNFFLNRGWGGYFALISARIGAG